jgi:hypothetical protein
MFRLPFGKKEWEELQRKERQELLYLGRVELEKSLESSSEEPIEVTTKAFGYLIDEGSRVVEEDQYFVNDDGDESYKHLLIRDRDNRKYVCITDRRVLS